MPDVIKLSEAPKAPKPIMKSAIEWAAQKGVQTWQVAATAHRVKWEIEPQCDPTMVSESDFDSAIAETVNHRLG